MMRAFGRMAAAALLAGLLGAAWVSLFYAWRASLHVEFDRDLPRLATGIYPSERNDSAQLTFAWTGPDAVVRLPGLDRSRPWVLTLRASGGRPANNPSLTVLADGLVIGSAPIAPGWSDLRFEIPALPERRGLVIGLQPSSTFVPGNGDSRALGITLDRMSLASEGVVLVPRPALIAAAAASAAMGAALALLGVTAGSAIGGAVVISAGIAAIVSRGFGPFTDYPALVIRLGVALGIALAALALWCEALRRQPLRNTARFATAFTAAALLLKLLVLLHPDMPIGDAMFHAHRFQGVVAGNLYFTSIAPGGYSFPYAPGLYVFASAFKWLVRRGPQDVVLLRVITASVDAIAGLLLYTVIAAVWRARLAGAIAVAIYQLLPLDFAVLTTGNLTNAFAQSVAIGALVLMGSGLVTLRRLGWVALLAAVLAAAYLSHTSTVAIVFVATMAIALLFLVQRSIDMRSGGAAVALASLVAAAIAVALYYSHFTETYRAEFARIGQETASNAADAGGRTIGDRLGVVPYSIGLLFGWPVFALAVGGFVLRWRRGADTLLLAVTGWTISCLVFLVIGVLTPVDMRYYLAALPVVAIAAGYAGAWTLVESPRPQRTAWRVAGTLALAGAVAAGVRHWWSVLG